MSKETLQQISHDALKTLSRTKLLGRQQRSKGIVALFVGPSGRRKTMAAPRLAKDLCTSLQRVNLNKATQKYIGETEKNLARIFDTATKKRAVLVIEEAEVLLGKRTTIKDSHDRYANLETNYLLNRIESFPGLVILTTNNKKNVDSAFLRRVKHVVSFSPSKPALR